ncbi:MAG: 23S rRNA (adenine(2503)-C(2))-methyltransferase RlmN [Candidatus Bipolaricaulota bacterium]|nr:23S rRNA (adenine(2503)-C(2))-methyltransferase RlmN [Candidatus Bipolaricaulota bacterium]MDW8126633.1 23S rRNA (adenine(2503)-C(2))-methyltransferase RlmN [Candidatus Bipolaricaulota bacterium]
MSPRLILDFSFDEVVQELRELGQPNYRARQVWEWIWRHLAQDFFAMTNLPLPLREELGQRFLISTLEVLVRECDEEGTEKVLFALPDGASVEAVLIREEGRRTVCISTQVGCPVGCTFCATGQMGFVRNLSAGEIAAQVLHFARALRDVGEHVTHVVVMGMGEPFLNYEDTLKALLNLNDPRGFNLGARRITVSTIGVVPAMLRFAQEGRQFNLAVSLHAPDDRLRKKLVPLADRWPIKQIISAVDAYILATGRRVTFEYVLLGGVNDQLRHARALASLLRGRLVHVNLIPFNPAPGLPFQPPDAGQVELFRQELLAHGIDVTVRRSRGVKIQAGCGQLRSRVFQARNALPGLEVCEKNHSQDKQGFP